MLHSAPSLQSIIVHSIRVGISEVKLCTSRHLVFISTIQIGEAPLLRNSQAISKTKNGPLSAPYAAPGPAHVQARDGGRGRWGALRTNNGSLEVQNKQLVAGDRRYISGESILFLRDYSSII
ncbi:hypothetical protein EVAR_16930_1 [Eumeta japonica]|uniref:Uncharacterized protein n=1 Tax=Eumeta variegata TaxID=151549 RepID=A0A4C1TWF9_EUMVA|nr:hypothetical protein EVAR_16930_1 [Eumeta japonica]